MNMTTERESQEAEENESLSMSVAEAMSVAERILNGDAVDDEEVLAIAAFAMESIDLIRDLEKQAAYLKGWQDGNRELHRTAEEED
jgi:predicted component of type VI protein secretion system